MVELALQTAKAGQAADPQNGFFPAMEAVALLESHHDTEALAALHSAAVSQIWETYSSDETKARWRLRHLAHGEAGGLPRYMDIASTNCFPIRQMAHIAVALALQKEMAGNQEGGFAIRRDLMHLGVLMRTEARSTSESRLGTILTDIAAERPNGAPAFEQEKYVCITIVALVQDRQIRQTAEAMTAHEGRYYASLLQFEWQGKVVSPQSRNDNR